MADLPCRIVLVGMMGSGKSTIGRALSQRTGWPLHDNDTLLERHGLSARAILAERGETELRAAESAALKLGLQLEPPSIVDAAAGTILDDTIRRALADELVVWLRAKPETLFARAQGAAHRPFLDRGEEWFRQTAAVRDPLYASVADMTIDTDSGDGNASAAEVLSRMGERCADS